MNIEEAKDQIKNAITAYLTKDSFGEYIIPIEKQRPLFLMGPPGIGKTAIVEQAASEMGVGLLSYSMTHHTRQSILGLPLIEHKTYKGKEYDISEYTMSEIIASIYELMEETGIEEGILFLDEINCVSETLAPIMLQFLQYKMFGRHHIPDGWIVVTAGNPPEYNNVVRDFDIVTWDRLKRIDVEPDLSVWIKYAYSRNIHPAVLSYLEIEKQNFYRVESTVDGKSFVTARGWEDLSQIIKLYELHNINVDEKLISQYIQNSNVNKSFSVYYDLFNKYKSDYQINKIINGKYTPDIIQRAQEAKFDERLSVIGLILDSLGNMTIDVMNIDSMLRELMAVLKEYKIEVEKTKKIAPAELLNSMITHKKNKISSRKKSGSRRREDILVLNNMVSCLEAFKKEIKECSTGEEAYTLMKDLFNVKVRELGKLAQETVANAYNNAFSFFEKVYSDGQEMLIFVTELTLNPHTAKYISKYGCKKYFEHNKNLLFYERKIQIDKEIDALEL